MNDLLRLHEIAKVLKYENSRKVQIIGMGIEIEQIARRLNYDKLESEANRRLDSAENKLDQVTP